jgi:hypothetical protein
MKMYLELRDVIGLFVDEDLVFLHLLLQPINLVRRLRV